MGRMSKEELRVLALEEALKEARKEYDEALNDVFAGKGRGVYGNKYDAREIELRRKVALLEKEYSREKGLLEALSDEEVEELAEEFVYGCTTKREKLSEDEEDFLNRLAFGM